jgi:hypothetical protein
LGKQLKVTFFRVRPIEKAPVRLGIFPEEWFQAFYSKTGVTGPYMALVSIGTFLVSKEYFVLEHDFYVGIGLAVVLTGKYVPVRSCYFSPSAYFFFRTGSPVLISGMW